MAWHSIQKQKTTQHQDGKMIITFFYRSIDDPMGWTETFDSLEEAKKHFLHFMGKTYDIGSSYAVNGYGDVTCTVEGATWRELGLE
jgi:hypothetical protein